MAREYWNKNDTRLKLQDFRLRFFHSFWSSWTEAYFVRFDDIAAKIDVRIFSCQKIQQIPNDEMNWRNARMMNLTCFVFNFERALLFVLSLLHSLTAFAIFYNAVDFIEKFEFLLFCKLFAQLLHPLVIEIDTALSQSQSHSVVFIQCMRCCVATQNKYQ